MLDTFNREINTLRISVTKKCNLKCSYCYTEDIEKTKEKIISFSDILKVAADCAKLGITKIKLTGGEPLLRKGLTELVGKLSQIEGINDLSITTNGILLAKYAKDLKKNGLDRINVSLDSINSLNYKKITCGGDLHKVFKGLSIAKSLNFKEIKINTVLLTDNNVTEIENIKKYASDNGFTFQLINQMNLNFDKSLSENFTKTDKPPDCHNCNRIRLTADGKLLPCLFNGEEIKITDFSNVLADLQKCINNKPEKGSKTDKKMFQIGG